jgi:DNA-binding PadR family transcriptional regulator
MESEGLLSSRTQIVEGRSRRSNSITDSGRRVLKETMDQLREFADEVLGVQSP